jgi:glycosyltransferase involved in cell wall biosynthesis
MRTHFTPLISVVIPCYNVSNYVQKAVNSILSQSYKNLEILIIDDASTDNTLEKINTINDKRIKVFAFKENTEKIGAVNQVLQKVNGDFITFQDSDDWSEPERLQEQLKEFEKDDELGVCFTNYKYISNKIFLPGKISLSDEELKNEFLNYTYKKVEGTSPSICATIMMSREALQKTKGYNPYFRGRVAEDIQWIYRILKEFKGITINKRLYNYRLREESFTQIQAMGIKPKYAYSWQLLSKIIHQDIKEGIDVLKPENSDLLKKIELEACEEALSEKIRELNDLQIVYESSARYKLGKLLLAPWSSIRRIMKF